MNLGVGRVQNVTANNIAHVNIVFFKTVLFNITSPN